MTLSEIESLMFLISLSQDPLGLDLLFGWFSFPYFACKVDFLPTLVLFQKIPPLSFLPHFPLLPLNYLMKTFYVLFDDLFQSFASCLSVDLVNGHHRNHH